MKLLHGSEYNMSIFSEFLIFCRIIAESKYNKYDKRGKYWSYCTMETWCNKLLANMQNIYDLIGR